MSDVRPNFLRVRVAESGEIQELRHRILAEGTGRTTCAFPGDELETTVHLAAVDGEGRIVGCLTLMADTWEGEPAWRLRGMAVDEAWQGRGVGRQLVEHVHEQYVWGEGGKPIAWCNARDSAIGFYERMGWVVVGDDVHYEGVIPHHKMTYKLKATQSDQ